MANAIYGPARPAIMDGVIRLKTDDIKLVLVDATKYGYSYNHQYLSSITGITNATTVGTGGAPSLTGKALQPSDMPGDPTYPDFGVFDADDVQLLNVPNPEGTQTFEACALYHNVGASDAARRLVAYIDQATSGLPVLTNGGDVTIEWAQGGSPDYRIFMM